MKKKLCALIALVLMLLPAGAMAENWYLEQGLVLAEQVDALAADEAYCSLYSSSRDILELVREFADGDYSRPVRARMLVLPDETGTNTLFSLVGLIAGEEMPAMSETSLDKFAKGIPNMIVSLANGSMNSTWLAASTMLNAHETHIMPEGFTPGVLFLDYSGDYAIAVTFSKTGAETITASASMIRGGFVDDMTGDLPFAAKLLVNGMFREIALD